MSVCSWSVLLSFVMHENKSCIQRTDQDLAWSHPVYATPPVTTCIVTPVWDNICQHRWNVMSRDCLTCMSRGQLWFLDYYLRPHCDLSTMNLCVHVSDQVILLGYGWLLHQAWCLAQRFRFEHIRKRLCWTDDIKPLTDLAGDIFNSSDNANATESLA